MKLREITVSHRGATHLTSKYTDVTLKVGEGKEEEYIKKEYPNFISEQILAVKEDTIFMVTKFHDKTRGGFWKAIGVEEAKKLCPEQMENWCD